MNRILGQINFGTVYILLFLYGCDKVVIELSFNFGVKSYL